MGLLDNININDLSVDQAIKVKSAYAQAISSQIALKKKLEDETDNTSIKIQPNHISFVTAFPLRRFISETFNILEQGNEYKDNWHIDAISEVLTACTTGQCKRVLISLPRRCMKSTLVSVMWFAWSWTFLPHTRWLYASYSAEFAYRDSKKCRDLIRSAWYQQRFGDVFGITRFQEDKTKKFANDKGGFRVAFGVGKGTGEGGHFVGCFPKGELVKTQDGYLPIEEIVEKRMKLIIPSFNTKTNKVELKPVIGWSINPPNQIIEVTFSDGFKLKCTPDHRLWTSNKGWVEAQDLLPTDMLPRFPVSDISNSSFTDVQIFSQPAITFSGLQNKLNSLFRQFSISNVFSFGSTCSNFGGYVRPIQTTPNLINSIRTKPVFFSDFFSSFITPANFNRNTLSDFRSSSFFVESKSSVIFRILNILRTSSIFKIAKMIVGWFTVLMSYFLTFWAFTDKRQQDLLMDEQMNVNAISQGVKSCVSFAWRSFNNSFFNTVRNSISSQRSSCFASDSTETGNTVNSFKTDYRFPLFIKHIGYVPKTYCLTVKDNHTFYATSKIGGDFIVANCDDPHQIDESASEVIVAKTVQWYLETYSNNVVDPQNACKFNMHQRVDEDDLTGAILAKELGYEYLCLPMNFEDDHPHKNSVSKPFKLGTVSKFEKADNPNLEVGEPKEFVDPRDTQAPFFENKWYQEWYKKSFAGRGLTSDGEGQELWLNHFRPEDIDDICKNLGTFGISAQLQQRPIKRGGNFFHSDDFLTNGKPVSFSTFDFNNKVYCRFWDKSGTEGGGHWTVGLLLARTKIRPFQFTVVDVIRVQYSYHKRMELMIETAESDRLNYLESKQGCELTIGIEGEKNSSAKDVSSLERESLLGYDVFIEYPKMDKAERAKVPRKIADSGLMKMLEGKWNHEFLRELEKFNPEKKRQTDDQVDALSGATRKLIFGIVTQRYSTSGAN